VGLLQLEDVLSFIQTGQLSLRHRL